jgi:pimeloyl-ACP methyl ester carboxylesterase
MHPIPLVLVNGLAEQPQSWFANVRHLSRRFEVERPDVLVYDGDPLHRRIDAGLEITVDYLSERLGTCLDRGAHRPPYHLVASSLGCQVAVTFAVAHPEKVARLVLLCPSGFHGDEDLPVVAGVRRNRYDALVGSVFHDERHVDGRLIAAFEEKFRDRRWKKGVLRTLRGTVGHSVAPLLRRVSAPTLVVWGAEDRILADVPGSIRAAAGIPDVRQVVIPGCGHAPQIEKAWLVNRLIVGHLTDRLGRLPMALNPARLLDHPGEAVARLAPLPS